AGKGIGHATGIKKSHAVGEFSIVGIPGKDGSRVAFQKGYHMHLRFRTKLSQYPFYIPGNRKFPLPARPVMDLEHGKLYAGIGVNKYGHFRKDAIFAVLKNAVTESMPGNIRCFAPCRQWSRRPKPSAFFIAQVITFSFE